MPSEVYQSASGMITSRRGTIVFPSIAVAATATASASVSFAGAEVGDTVNLSPRASLGTGAIFNFARVSSANVIEIHVASVSAAVTIATQSCDISIFHV